MSCRRLICTNATTRRADEAAEAGMTSGGWEGRRSTDPSSSTPSTRRLPASQDFDGGLPQAARVAGHYALVAAKDSGPAAFVDRREATKLPDTHLKTWESKSKS